MASYFPSISGCRSVEQYKILNRIEEGTYGVVYRAKDKDNNEVVALKRLKMEQETNGFPITSLREISTLLECQHQNVIELKEIVVGPTLDKIYLVMEYAEHDLKSLMKEMIRKKQKFSDPDVKYIMKQLLEAINHLHNNWIIHRDLKPSNLLINSEGVLKVADFGLAREYGHPMKSYTPNVVTLWYRSPEILLGEKEYSTPIDMWSCGCIFGEMFLMHPLFTGTSEIDQLKRIYKLVGSLHENDGITFIQSNSMDKKSLINDPSKIERVMPLTTLTQQAQDLMKQLLKYDPRERISCENALRAKYLSNFVSKTDLVIFQELSKSFW